jgi:hypothetical protein
MTIAHEIAHAIEGPRVKMEGSTPKQALHALNRDEPLFRQSDTQD